MPSASVVRRRSPWIDLRLVLGLILVVCSVAAVWLIVVTARQTGPALVATRTLVAGEPIDADDVRVVEVALGTVTGYLEPGALGEGAVAVRTVGVGELVPDAAVAPEADRATTTVVVRTGAEVPGAVVPGAPVELWGAPARADGGFDAARILVADAVVADVGVPESALGAVVATVELVVPREDVPEVLDAIAAADALSIVPAVGG